MASFDHAIDASSVSTLWAASVSLRRITSDLKGLALMLVARKSKNRACGCDHAIVQEVNTEKTMLYSGIPVQRNGVEHIFVDSAGRSADGYS